MVELLAEIDIDHDMTAWLGLFQPGEETWYEQPYYFFTNRLVLNSAEYLWYDLTPGAYTNFYEFEPNEEECVALNPVLGHEEANWVSVPCNDPLPAVVCWGDIREEFELIIAGEGERLYGYEAQERCEERGLTMGKILSQAQNDKV